MKEAVWRLSMNSIHGVQIELLLRFFVIFFCIMPFITSLTKQPFILFLDNISLINQIFRLLLFFYSPFFILGFIRNTLIIINNVFLHTDRIIAYTDAQGLHLVTGRKTIIRFSTGLGKRYPDYHIAWQDIHHFSFYLDTGSRFSLPDRFIFYLKRKSKVKHYLNHFGDSTITWDIAEAIIARLERGEIVQYQAPILKVSRLAWQILCLNFLIMFITYILYLMKLINPAIFLMITILLIFLINYIPAEKFCYIVS